MTDTQRKVNAKKFAEFWAGKGYEKGQSQSFWTSLLRDVYGVEHPEEYVIFEEQVQLGHTSFIDARIPKTKVLIEQKSLNKNLTEKIKQSDGTLKTPFEQAKRYDDSLGYFDKNRWLVICNFQTFHVYDMANSHGEPEVINLCDLEKEYHRLDFLVDTQADNTKRELEISQAAGKIVGQLYDALLKQYPEPHTAETYQDLNVLCVRLVFCLYAEDADIFGEHLKFNKYLRSFDTQHTRKALQNLFDVLNQPMDERDPFLKDDEPLLAEFPYVNGSLFEKKHVIPPFSDEIRNLLLREASLGFDWSEISPTIFGAIFESTLNPETRRNGGMHYTMPENIHKVIDPLFLDDLGTELDGIMAEQDLKKRKLRLTRYQDKLAGLKFLDPACGSGNFLTETYLSLRKLENKVIAELISLRKKQLENQIVFGGTSDEELIKVSISQFYGIEINDFAVSVAKTALWIAENQMLRETEKIINQELNFLPLTTIAHIKEENALTYDWEDLVSKYELSYIMGNPPFVGGMMMTREQHDDLANAFPECKKVGEADYVVGWYAKAANLIKDTNIRCAFVSTNSICQGQSVASVWKPLLDKGVHIDFAYRTFQWDSETDIKAHVHCIIVGFSSAYSAKDRFIFTLSDGEITKAKANNINGYLTDGDNIFIDSRSAPLCDVPAMHIGNMPRDGGGFILSPEEKDELIVKEPLAAKWVKSYVGADEFLNNKKRYCLWLLGASPSELRSCKEVARRVESVREFRAKSKAAGTRKFAETPTLFAQITQPMGVDFILVPKVSSERRRYVPMGFMTPETLCSDLVFIIPDATLYHFGVLTSNVHMAWMRAVCGRLKSDYRYSKDIVYNNFPWCSPTDAQREKIERTAQGILDARALYPDSSLADLYDEAVMPPELRKAHQANDAAVAEAYGISRDMPEAEVVAMLMKRYQEMTGEK